MGLTLSLWDNLILYTLFIASGMVIIQKSKKSALATTCKIYCNVRGQTQFGSIFACC